MAEAAPARLERLATGAGVLLLASRGDVLLAAEFDAARLDRTLARRGLAAAVAEAPPSPACRRLAAPFSTPPWTAPSGFRTLPLAQVLIDNPNPLPRQHLSLPDGAVTLKAPLGFASLYAVSTVLA